MNPEAKYIQFYPPDDRMKSPRVQLSDYAPNEKMVPKFERREIAFPIRNLYVPEPIAEGINMRMY